MSAEDRYYCSVLQSYNVYEYRQNHIVFTKHDMQTVYRCVILAFQMELIKQYHADISFKLGTLNQCSSTIFNTGTQSFMVLL